MIHRHWRPAATAVTACSTRTPSKRSAPRSTLPRGAASRVWDLRPSPPLRPRAILVPTPEHRRPRLPQPRQHRPQPSKGMTATATASTCARLDAVSKLFGSFAALRQVCLELEPARCYVLIGPNGAGKSTLLRILAGLLRPSMGTISVFDNQEPHDARDRI